MQRCRRKTGPAGWLPAVDVDDEDDDDETNLRRALTMQQMPLADLP